MVEPSQYRRQTKREGPVPLSTKIAYGIGSLPETLKEFAFVTLLLFYYNQVLHLPAGSAALALMLALIADAVTDPIVGSFSDSLRTKLGRRHPLMYGAAVPLGVSLYLLFSPPAGLSEVSLFLWLTGTAISVRVAMTFFQVPWLAFFAELSDDYDERTKIVTVRFIIAWIAAALFVFTTWTYIFPTTAEYTPGHLNPAAYQKFALLLAFLVTVSIFLTTHLTRREIPFLLQPTGPVEPFGARRVFSELLMALKNANLRGLFLCVLLASAILGTYKNLEIYVNTYFWGLAPEDLRWFALAIIGAVIAFGAVGPLQKRFDKKNILVGCMIFVVADGIFLIGMRLLDLLPANGSPLLLVILVVNLAIRMGVVTILSIMFMSMLADIVDAIELETSQRQEGMASAAISFSQKVTTGFGALSAGLLLQYVIGFPVDVRPENLDSSTIIRLGVVVGALVPSFYIFAVFFVRNYDLSRSAHQEVREKLAERKHNVVRENQTS